MNKIIARCVFISSIAVYFTVSVSAPWVFSDNNTFLREFVNHEFMNLLGVIVAITLASAANLHLQFNQIEDSVKRTILIKTRIAIKRSAFWLIGLFSLGFLLVMIKPLLPTNEISMSLVNGAAILIVIFNILVLTDLTQLAFNIPPIFKMLDDEETDETNT